MGISFISKKGEGVDFGKRGVHLEKRGYDPSYQLCKYGAKLLFFSSFMINFRIVNIRPIYQSLDKRI